MLVSTRKEERLGRGGKREGPFGSGERNGPEGDFMIQTLQSFGERAEDNTMRPRDLGQPSRCS